MIHRVARVWRGVRFRITVIAIASVVVVLSVGGFALLRVQRTQLLDNLDVTLGQRADDLESTSLVAPADPPLTLANLAGDDAVVQIVDPTGKILAASANAVDGPVIGPTGGEGQTIRTVESLPVEDDEYRVLSRPIELDTGPATLHVASNTDDLREVLSVSRAALLLVVPFAAVAIGAVVWVLVGRTLRPVESIRRRVAEIDGAALSARVPTPGTHDEIDLLARTMNDMLARQERSVRSQQQFVADASHELRTPIARMRTELDTGGDDVIDGLSAEVDHLGALVDDLLHLARADGGHGTIRPRAVDLDDLVFDEIRLIRPTNGVAVDASLVSAAHVGGDPSQLRRLVSNLLDNAVRHARTAVTVELHETDQGTVRFSVADDGEGIAPEDAHRIFERFVRLDVARTRDRGGTGLGLAIVRDIVHRHDGTIAVETSEGAGTRFVVTLPAPRDHVRRP